MLLYGKKNIPSICSPHQLRSISVKFNANKKQCTKSYCKLFFYSLDKFNTI